nr:glycosyltransferase [Propionicimonas sp.]
MRIVVTGYGSTGDTQPLVALAAGLRRAGHQVVLVTDHGAEADASRLGLDFRVLPGSARSIVTAGSHGWDEAISSGRASMRMLAAIARFNTRAWIEAIDAAAEGADAVVASTLAVYHAASVTQERGIPLIFAQLQPSLATRDYPPPASGLTGIPRWLNRPSATAIAWIGDLSFRSGINRVRRELGRPGLRLVWDDVPILLAWSPVLVPASADWTHPDATITGPWRLPADPGWQPPADLAAFLAAGEPPVYVGFGSMAGFAGTTALRDALLEGLSAHRVLLSSGWAGLADTDLPDNVHPVGWVPHDWLFPRCAAIVHHCGAGTTHQAARSGVPSIPVPFTLDQPFWASRLRTLGIASAPLNPRRPSASAVRDALAEATTLRRRVVVEDGVSTAIGTIERIVAS